MSMNTVARTAAILAALAACLVAGAADRVWHPYREICERLGLKKFHEIPEAQKDHLRILFKVPAGDPALRALVLTIDSRQHPRTIVPDATGAIEFPYDEALLQENPNVLVNLPEGKKASFELDLRPRAPTALDLSYNDLMGGVAQANALIRAEAGMLSLFAPTLHGVVLQFERADGQAVTIGTGATQRRIGVDAQARITVPYDAALATANPPMTLSALPQGVDFSE